MSRLRLHSNCHKACDNLTTKNKSFWAAGYATAAAEATTSNPLFSAKKRTGAIKTEKYSKKLFAKKQKQRPPPRAIRYRINFFATTKKKYVFRESNVRATSWCLIAPNGR